MWRMGLDGNDRPRHVPESGARLFAELVTERGGAFLGTERASAPFTGDDGVWDVMG